VKRRLAAWLGLASVAWTAGVTLLGGALRPGYSHASQYISELGESGAVNGGWVSFVGFAPIGLLVLGFLALAAPYLPGGRWRNVALGFLAFVGFGYLAASVARCEPGCSGTSVSQSVHNLFGLFEYVGALVGLRLLFYPFRRSEEWRGMASASMLAAVVVAAGFLGMLTPALAEWRGVSQRIAEAGIFGWIAWLSLRLLRQPSGEG
jgi:hypothetical protein